MAEDAEKKRNRRERLRAEGKCITCGKPRGVTLYKTKCFSCGGKPKARGEHYSETEA